MAQVDDKNILYKFVTDFCNILEKHAEYIIVSGFFVIASGKSRGTEDIDLIFEWLSYDKFELLHKDLVAAGFNCIQEDNPKEIYEYLKDNLAVRYIFGKIYDPNMEIKFTKDALDELQIKNKQKYALTGLDLWFAPLECCIVFKEEYLKSKKDLDDARHLRGAYSNILNENRLVEYKELLKRYRHA